MGAESPRALVPEARPPQGLSGNLPDPLSLFSRPGARGCLKRHREPENQRSWQGGAGRPRHLPHRWNGGAQTAPRATRPAQMEGAPDQELEKRGCRSAARTSTLSGDDTSRLRLQTPCHPVICVPVRETVISVKNPGRSPILLLPHRKTWRKSGSCSWSRCCLRGESHPWGFSAGDSRSRVLVERPPPAQARLDNRVPPSPSASPPAAHGLNPLFAVPPRYLDSIRSVSRRKP